MTKRQLIIALKELDERSEFGAIATASIEIIERSSALIIGEFDEINSVNRESLLRTYRVKQTRLRTTEGTVLGFDETIAALDRHEGERVIILVVHADDQLLTIVADPEGVFLGCYIGKAPAAC